MVLALLLSRSRLGVLSLIVATTVVLGLDYLSRSRRRSAPGGDRSRQGRMTTLLVVTGIAAVSAAAFIGLEPLVDPDPAPGPDDCGVQRRVHGLCHPAPSSAQVLPTLVRRELKPSQASVLGPDLAVG